MLCVIYLHGIAVALFIEYHCVHRKFWRQLANVKRWLFRSSITDNRMVFNVKFQWRQEVFDRMSFPDNSTLADLVVAARVLVKKDNIALYVLMRVIIMFQVLQG